MNYRPYIWMEESTSMWCGEPHDSHVNFYHAFESLVIYESARSYRERGYNVDKALDTLKIKYSNDSATLLRVEALKKGIENYRKKKTGSKRRFQLR